MNVKTCILPGLLILEPQVFQDERGYFFESYRQSNFLELGLNLTFVQDNESKSKRGVLRGLHFQAQNPQGKLVRVIQGEVFDVAVDIRQGSPTYGQWESVLITAENKTQFYIPPGFAHGFLVLSEDAIFSYKCTTYYDPSSDSGILWDDPDIDIKWPLELIGEPSLSPKDQQLKRLCETKSPFTY